MRPLGVAVIQQWVDPFEAPPWSLCYVSCNDAVPELRTLVAECLRSVDLESMSYDELIDAGDQQSAPDADLYWHARRIAFLVVNGWQDAITLNLGGNFANKPRIEDGNHRFAAAIYLGHIDIHVDVLGEKSVLLELLGEQFFEQPNIPELGDESPDENPNTDREACLGCLG